MFSSIDISVNHNSCHYALYIPFRIIFNRYVSSMELPTQYFFIIVSSGCHVSLLYFMIRKQIINHTEDFIAAAPLTLCFVDVE